MPCYLKGIGRVQVKLKYDPIYLTLTRAVDSKPEEDSTLYEIKAKTGISFSIAKEILTFDDLNKQIRGQ